ncbi:hypothetical protein BN3590_04013 [Clostridium sp. C105KSO15]|nr:hypothetical protein BN3590_04013 [Clostridium sp. C105KSO15]
MDSTFTQSPVSGVIKYIRRYLGRDIIATSWIDSYDGIVTFHYNKREDNSYIVKTIYVMDYLNLPI